MEFISQNKGKMWNKLPRTKAPRRSEMFFYSDKIDGAYIQVHVDKEAAQVKFYTSGGKEFHIKKAARGFILAAKNYRRSYVVFECEYNYGSEGKHGDRTSAAKITTYRNEYAKGISTVGSSQDRFSIFDTIEYDRVFKMRLIDLQKIIESVNIKILSQTMIEFGEAKEIAENNIKQGWEGIMLKSPYHVHKPDRTTSYRTNDIIKFKFPQVGVARVIKEIEGDGRLQGLIGAVEVEFNYKNTLIRFNIGTGFSDLQRSKWGEYLDKDIEFEYESIQIRTPVQPSYKGFVK